MRRKRVLCIVLCVAFLLLSIKVGYADGLLPSLDDAYGIPMPSMFNVLHRYPDEIVKTVDGASEQHWSNVSDSDFEAYGTYLGKSGAALKEYTVNNGVFEAVVEKDNRAFTFTYSSELQVANIIFPVGVYDEKVFEAESRYNMAKEFMAEGKYEEAYNELISIDEYQVFQDVSTLLQNDNNLFEIVLSHVGNFFYFGHYEQDNNLNNGKEPIEWIILNVNNNHALLISRYALDVMPFNTSFVNCSWEKCTLRNWLNEEFLHNAFTLTEQNSIVTTGEICQDQNSILALSYYSTDDYIFLLSENEASLLFSTDDSRRCIPTEYVIAQNPSYSNKEFCLWWLRSFYNSQNVNCVNSLGNISHIVLTHKTTAVRPALYIAIDSDSPAPTSSPVSTTSNPMQISTPRPK